jgi:hypothetical protein
MIQKYIILSIGLLTTVAVFYLLIRRRIARKQLRENLLNGIDEGFQETTHNIVLSISKSKDLYKSLIKQVHPDKFQDDKKAMATELSMKLTKAKRNYNELLKIKDEVEIFRNS